MKRGLILFFLIVGNVCFSQNYSSFEEMKENIISKTIPLISAQELKKAENTTTPFFLLDAREKKEFDVSHLKNAKHVGYDNFGIASLEGIKKETTIIVYCSVGYRSEKVGEKLKKAGYKKVLNLKGGIFDWVNSGFPVYDDGETKKIHPYDEAWGKWLIKGEKAYE